MFFCNLEGISRQLPSLGSFILGPGYLFLRLSFAEVNHQTGADAEVVLVVVAAIVEGGQQEVGFDEAHREAGAGAQVEASAEVSGKGRAGVGGGRIGALDERATGVRQAD